MLMTKCNFGSKFSLMTALKTICASFSLDFFFEVYEKNYHTHCITFWKLYEQEKHFLMQQSSVDDEGSQGLVVRGRLLCSLVTLSSPPPYRVSFTNADSAHACGHVITNFFLLHHCSSGDPEQKLEQTSTNNGCATVHHSHRAIIPNVRPHWTNLL